MLNVEKESKFTGSKYIASSIYKTLSFISEFCIIVSHFVDRDDGLNEA